MTQGVVTGGWNFVIAAYSITAAVLIVYGISLVARLRDEQRRSE
jgi:hypothetical protein